MADEQSQAHPFDAHFDAFLVDLNGDGKPDAVVKGRKLSDYAAAPAIPGGAYGPSLDEFDMRGAPSFGTQPDQGDIFTLRYGGRRIGGIPDSLPSPGDVGNLLMRGIDFGLQTAAAAGATGGPPGAILGNGARAIRNLPATAGAVAERIGQMFAEIGRAHV